MDKSKLCMFGEKLKTNSSNLSRIICNKMKEILETPMPESKTVDRATSEASIRLEKPSCYFTLPRLIYVVEDFDQVIFDFISAKCIHDRGMVFLPHIRSFDMHQIKTVLLQNAKEVLNFHHEFIMEDHITTRMEILQVCVIFSNQAVNAFRRMLAEGLTPSLSALNSLINAFGEDRRDAEAFVVL
ncbi:hypothetical protein RYX36_023674 [Vicia faba]